MSERPSGRAWKSSPTLHRPASCALRSATRSAASARRCAVRTRVSARAASVTARLASETSARASASADSSSATRRWASSTRCCASRPVGLGVAHLLGHGLGAFARVGERGRGPTRRQLVARVKSPAGPSRRGPGVVGGERHRSCRGHRRRRGTGRPARALRSGAPGAGRPATTDRARPRRGWPRCSHGRPRVGRRTTPPPR